MFHAVCQFSLLVIHIVFTSGNTWNSEVDLVIDPICYFIAATNIGVDIYPEWSCEPNGTTTSDPCGNNWRGITCMLNSTSKLEYISEIELYGLDLTGTLADNIGKMTTLGFMNIASGQLNGSIPVSMGCMTNLGWLELGLNSLTGSIPSSLGDTMSMLAVLYLYSNELTGTIPASLLRCSFLEYMDLGGNHLSGSVPTDFSGVPRLEMLMLYWSKFTGPIPSGLGTVSGLKVLQLQYNSFTGRVPSFIGALSVAENLQLESNSLTGTIPELWVATETLKLLELGDNALSGPLPEGLGALSALETLFLSGCSLTGTAPAIIGSNCTKLRILKVSSNSLWGTLPVSWTTLPEVTEFNIAGNSFSGTLPAGIDIFTKVQTLTMENNCFEGTLPSSLCATDMSQLKGLHAGGNKFRGPIPTNICGFQQLQELTLEDNSLTGTIPSLLGQCSALYELSLAGNSLRGGIPTSLGELTHVWGFFLGGNCLTGSIPSALAGQLKVQQLQLFDNMLNGSIPTELGALERLLSLDLHANSLSGELPMELYDVSALRWVNLSCNILSGPLRLTDHPAMHNLDLSANSFSGSLPVSVSPTLASLSVAGNAITGTIPAFYGSDSELKGISVASTLIAGVIPADFCNTEGVSLDVSGTAIACYSGCLTSAAVLVTGASPECHDGTILRDFLIVVGCVSVSVLLASAAYYQHRVGVANGAKLSGLNPLTHLQLYPRPSVAMDKSNLEGADIIAQRSNRSIVFYTFAKLVFAVIISLTLNNWWTYGGHTADGIVESCASPTDGHCHSFCGDVETVPLNITDDDYGFTVTLPVEVYINPHYTISAYCVANFRQNCAYQYWLLFKLVPLLFHIVGFLLQLVTLGLASDFNPQQRQYDIVLAHLYPDVFGDKARESGVYEYGQQKLNYAAMLTELLASPSSSVFVFLEMLTVLYVWGELCFPPVFCGAVRPLSLYYYPIAMSLLDLTKFNFYVATRLRTEKRIGEAAFVLLSVELFCTNLWVSMVLAVMFVVVYVKCLFHLLTFHSFVGTAKVRKGDGMTFEYMSMKTEFGNDHLLNEQLVACRESQEGDSESYGVET